VAQRKSDLRRTHLYRTATPGSPNRRRRGVGDPSRRARETDLARRVIQGIAWRVSPSVLSLDPVHTRFTNISKSPRGSVSLHLLFLQPIRTQDGDARSRSSCSPDTKRNKTRFCPWNVLNDKAMGIERKYSSSSLGFLHTPATFQPQWRATNPNTANHTSTHLVSPPAPAHSNSKPTSR